MKRGIYLVLLTALISGFSIFSNKIFVSQADPLVFTTVRNFVVGLMLMAVVIGSGKIPLFKTLKTRDWLKLLFIGVFGGGIAFALFFSGLTQIGAVQASVIHKTLFLWVTMLAIPLLKEKLHWLQIFGYLIIIAATFMVGGPFSLTFNQGALMVLTATIFWAAENIVAKIALKNIDAKIVGLMRIWFGLPILLAITFLSNKVHLIFDFQTLSFMPLLTSSLFLTGYILTWYHGLKLIPASLATSILVISPVITNILTSIFVTRSFPQIQIQSALLLTVGVGLLIVKGIRPQHQIT